MDFRAFHHPDLSLPVIRRRVAEELIDLTVSLVAAAATRGKSLTWSYCFPNENAHYAAVSRLQKAGLLVRHTGSQSGPTVELTKEGEGRASPLCRGRPPWPRKWNGIWYLLMYDVPEQDRRYRNVLREFLKQLRMGCLQKSVWVSPRDIRPEYDDLVKGIRVNFYAYLFEATTVLG
jgi:DNA-binding transcriptional regulator PaaX